MVPVTHWLPDAMMLQIAAENNLSETAFVREVAPGHVEIRWFSPLTEIDFCGHATLASAEVWFRYGGLISKYFRVSTQKVGDLTVQKGSDGWHLMDFPERLPTPMTEVPAALLAALPIAPVEVLRSTQAWFVVYAEAQDVVTLTPDLALLKQLGPYDVVVTAPAGNFGDGQYDFVSRYFGPPMVETKIRLLAQFTPDLRHIGVADWPKPSC
ncbi:MAG: PhzF family phenazine biosynthesis protein [Rheinheimera sp.]|nr:PhzF family phenazine biosynthesis protein [Rheinheimera sp.]